MTRLPMPFAILPVLATLLLLLGLVDPVGAQLAVLDPAAAKAANPCHKTVTAAVVSYSASTYKSFKTCIDAIFACIQPEADRRRVSAEGDDQVQ